MQARRHSRFIVAAVAAVALIGGSAMTASNTMPTETHAGAGSVTVTGYTAETIDYTLGTDPSTVDSVAIDITGEVTDGSEAQLQLVDAGAWYSCTIGAYDGTNNVTPLTCDTTGESLDTANDVTLAIAD